MSLETCGISTWAVHKASVIFSFLCYLRSVWQSKSTAPPSWRNQAVSRDVEAVWKDVWTILSSPQLPVKPAALCPEASKRWRGVFEKTSQNKRDRGVDVGSGPHEEKGFHWAPAAIWTSAVIRGSREGGGGICIVSRWSIHDLPHCNTHKKNRLKSSPLV